MKKYRKKPVEVEAVLWDGTTKTASDIMSWSGNKVESGNGLLVIHTLEGEMRATEGDYIIKGIKGEFYPCKPEIFEASYEEVKPDTGRTGIGAKLV